VINCEIIAFLTLIIIYWMSLKDAVFTAMNKEAEPVNTACRLLVLSELRYDIFVSPISKLINFCKLD